MRSEQSDPVVRRFVLVALVLPAAVAVAGLVVQLLALLHAPERIPVHWDGTGVANGWGPVWLPLVLTIVLGLGLPAAFGLSSLPGLRRGDRSPAFRLFGAKALGISVMQTVFATWLMLQGVAGMPSGGQRVWLPLLAGLGAGVVAALVGWLLQPTSRVAVAARSVVPLVLAPGERAAWMRTTSLPLPAVAVITAVTIVVGIRAAFGWAVGDRTLPAALLTVVALVLIALLAATVAFHVRVDDRGLSVRSVLGVPRFRVPLDDVDEVSVVDVRSLGVSGSWGIRAHAGRTTIVMRPSDGVRVTRRGGRTFFVTVDDAATAAALLEALVARATGIRAPARAGGDEGNG